MRMELCRTKFRKSCILLAKNWIECFPEKNQVKLRPNFEGKIWIDCMEAVEATLQKQLLACSHFEQRLLRQERFHVQTSLLAKAGKLYLPSACNWNQTVCQCQLVTVVNQINLFSEIQASTSQTWTGLQKPKPTKQELQKRKWVRSNDQTKTAKAQPYKTWATKGRVNWPNQDCKSPRSHEKSYESWRWTSRDMKGKSHRYLVGMLAAAVEIPTIRILDPSHPSHPSHPSYPSYPSYPCQTPSSSFDRAIILAQG